MELGKSRTPEHISVKHQINDQFYKRVTIACSLAKECYIERSNTTFKLEGFKMKIPRLIELKQADKFEEALAFSKPNRNARSGVQIQLGLRNIGESVDSKYRRYSNSILDLNTRHVYCL